MLSLIGGELAQKKMETDPNLNELIRSEVCEEPHPSLYTKQLL